MRITKRPPRKARHHDNSTHSRAIVMDSTVLGSATAFPARAQFIDAVRLRRNGESALYHRTPASYFRNSCLMPENVVGVVATLPKTLFNKTQLVSCPDSFISAAPR